MMLTSVLMAVMIVLLKTRSTTAHPVNDTTTASYVTGTKCDNTYAYCCKQRPTSSPSVDDIYGDLNGVVDLFRDKCKNDTIRDNPPSKDIEFTLERDNIDTQNDLIVGVMIKHMKLVQSMKASCKAKEHKFYRGEESMTEECNAIKCKAKFAEHRIVSYLLANKCGCKKNGEIKCHYEPHLWRREQSVIKHRQPLSLVICMMWDSFNFIHEIFGKIGQLMDRTTYK